MNHFSRTGTINHLVKRTKQAYHPTCYPTQARTGGRLIDHHRPFHSILASGSSTPSGEVVPIRIRAGIITLSSSITKRKMTSGADEKKQLSFPVTPYPKANPQEKIVRTAACVIIGDEILSGKTLDTNSNQFASLAFRLGINLKRIEVVPDEEDVIISTIRRLCEPENQVDMIITSGGIGPTHDDITYQSLAKVFDPQGELEYDQETIRRMDEYNARRSDTKTKNEEQRKARHRMALFPKKHAKVLFVEAHLWVPVVCLRDKIFILPGIPSLFQQLLQALMCNYISLPPETDKPHRVIIQTKLPESIIAPTLTRLSKQLKDEKQDIKLGSYPNLITGIVSISLIGIDLEKLNSFAQLIQLEFDTLSSSSDSSKSNLSNNSENKL
ncbi:hypothetical protein PGTUg99_029153 [Puccinia graminis f. sp. tritici]|uniref:MoaB/Mog domain-containing protein n=2 Tax=Puccinia graminis f. sp. tritici TaxID=56615 RepID=E3L2P8_PUCGT|nr:uncharacterized protein PGTG_16825 [Puccinia graminis f. sp. tritici CRL 75-36-700-3]EFP90799.1 hypothetical protein PGTG_16825 [Puccinia graminis f. sp. tritici CRL 75-36-700-3]KAA1138562.1 hypothetical protein PGTUg99_029153 [Puccinia graminis f. sp. tritici]